MADLPPLALARPTLSQREAAQGFPGRNIQGPNPAGQKRRLEHSLDTLSRLFAENAEGAMPDQHEPDRVLVLEIAGEIDGFINAVRRIEGFEFLAEQFEDEVDPDEFAAVTTTGERKRYRPQLFLIASSRDAWVELLRLWNMYQRGEPAPHNFGRYFKLFAQLRQIRLWSDTDRLERSGILEAWEHETDENPERMVPFEIELWFREDPEKRAEAEAALTQDLESVGGGVFGSSVINEIGYHGVLGRAPVALLKETVESHEVKWMRTDSVRFFQPSGQFATRPGSRDAEPIVAPAPPTEMMLASPRIALLDGVPMQNHDLLRNRLVLDDPDNWADLCPASRRVHGTGMASLIVHGDLSGHELPLDEPVYIRPIIRAEAPDWVDDPTEQIPSDWLAVDLIHASVTRLFEGERVAPDVKIVVLALGDGSVQFDRFISPIARLVDWLSHKYGLLFLVSAGNHLYIDGAVEIQNADDADEVQHKLLKLLYSTSISRRVLSPAESVNAVTVGAAHSDEHTAVITDGRVDPFISADLANVASAFGAGHRRSTKPDILFPGGRLAVRLNPIGGTDSFNVEVPLTSRPPGLMMASPAQNGGALNASSFATGTSCATALAGRAAIKLLKRLDEVREGLGDAAADERLTAVVIKAALTHTAKWGAAHAPLENVIRELYEQADREKVARSIGYGRAFPDDALTSDTNRVRCLRAGWIRDGQTLTFKFPLPSGLSDRDVSRRITTTLAWFTPLNITDRRYRRAALDMAFRSTPAHFAKQIDSTKNGAKRGTLQHEIQIGSRAVTYGDDHEIELVVSARADAGTLDEAIPFALMITLEAPEEQQLALFEEVRAKLAIPVPVRPRL